MEALILNFVNLFSAIDFKISEMTIRKSPSVEVLSQSENEVIRFLSDAKKDLREAKRLHKQGKISSEELFDHEFRVFELEEDLKRLQDEITGAEDLDENI